MDNYRMASNSYPPTAKIALSRIFATNIQKTKRLDVEKIVVFVLKK